jgi:hypothetical protein
MKADAARAGQPFPLDYVAFLTYAVEGTELAGRAAPNGGEGARERRGRQAYAVLQGYKAPGASRRPRAAAAAWTTWFLQRWGPWAAWPQRRLETEWLWATIPSVRSNRRGEHPFHAIVAAVLDAAREVTLRTSEAASGRRFDLGLFECDPLPCGSAVLVLDDSWTSGGNVFSAATALRQAGAASVNAMVLGRLLNPGAWAPSRQFIDAGGLRLGFDSNRSPWAKVS